MRKLVLAGMFGAALPFLATAPAEAQAREYPWCARCELDAPRCGFVSFQQCLATISGIGGRCEHQSALCAPQAACRPTAAVGSRWPHSGSRPSPAMMHFVQGRSPT